MGKSFRVLGLAALFLASASRAEPIKHHPANPHYYLFKGQPTILITSAEHYGGVINKDFDYVKYFDALKAYGMNYTRIYAGAMFEPADAYYIPFHGFAAVERPGPRVRIYALR